MVEKFPKEVEKMQEPNRSKGNEYNERKTCFEKQISIISAIV